MFKECCKQCRLVKFKGTMTKWPVQKQTHRTAQKHAEHQENTCIVSKCVVSARFVSICIVSFDSRNMHP